MEHGYAAFGSGMHWVEKKGWLDTFPGTGDSISPNPLTISHLEGFRCRSCRVITLRYESDESTSSPLPKGTPLSNGRGGRPTE